MPSVMGLLEERERVARQRVELLQTELREAEAALERFVIARETVGQVLAEPSGDGQAVVTVREERSAPVAGAVPGSVVPVRREGLEADVLAPDYRRIMAIVVDRGGEAMDCRQLAVARRTPFRLLAFLEDAHRRGVPRQVDGSYEFRHVELQRYLARTVCDRQP